MFTRSDLADLIDATPALGVSLFLPTHIRGSEIRQDPIRLKNLVADARDKLADAAVSRADADAMLAPAVAMIDDYEFWQHGTEGLAIFLADGQAHHYRVPLALDAKSVVKPGFHVKPLLPALAADGAFFVLTITADRVRLFEASRFAIAEISFDDLLNDVAAMSDADGGRGFHQAGTLSGSMV